MSYYIGIDLGTSSMKLILMDQLGSIHNTVSNEYPLYFPKNGWSEQYPEEWWNALLKGVPKLLDGFDRSQVKGIGCGGQMHGLVALDKNDNVIRPAIYWTDTRSTAEVRYLKENFGEIIEMAQDVISSSKKQL